MTNPDVQTRLRAAIATIAEITGIDERELTNIVTLAWYSRQANEAGGYDPSIMTHLEELIARRKRPEGHIEDPVEPPTTRDMKSALCGAIIHATEAAGLWNQGRFLKAIGMNEDWLGPAIEQPDMVPLDEYVRVYDQAAEQAGWQPLHLIVKEVTLRQRHREWP